MNIRQDLFLINQSDSLFSISSPGRTHWLLESLPAYAIMYLTKTSTNDV